MKKIILTGDRPTGRLHIGHYVGSLKMRVEMQNSGEYDSFIMIADMQALTDNAKTPEKVRENIIEVALDYLAVGLDPKKSTLFVQSQIPELCELDFYFMNLVTVARLERNPTVKTEIKQKEFGKSIPVGFFTYPISQAADILFVNADYVPVGEDQLPMVEQTREIAQTFNNTYGEVFKKPEAIIPKDALSRRLPGIDGNEKMGKSLNNAIYLADDEKTVREKIFSMYTDPNHLRVEDPGQVEGNMVFTYLDVFATDKAKVAEMKEHYKRGGLGDVACKKYLNEVMQDFLRPIRARREELAKDLDYVYSVLEEGSKKARKIAKETLSKVRSAIGVEYFKK
ncbi:MAG: tryptophan--tRNA ligase [Spirochaetales bacterium]